MILSNFQSAEKIATKMGQASDSIHRVTSNKFSTDDRTTLAVNSKAQEANRQALKLANLFNEAFQTTINNIQSTAEEFQRKDHEISIGINQSLPLTNYLKDRNTYEKARND
ncbi:type VII secretion effector, SACOL2603 family [Evansella caseinilytica]|uniref:Type VII secretion effector, SACOL2603 family n=1 Tax=Evansella caseinilytica TaxID=1503961 RepID=A0A1H3TT70_9BACI|nr:type VII secretion effector, SACOL2603 family [Evansella caseinilytica]